jgi:hypothetical protein
MDAHSGHFHCIRPGHQCVAAIKGNEFFLAPRMQQGQQDEVYDELLKDVTDKFNRKLGEAMQKRKDRNLRIAKTLRGLVLVWTEAAEHPKEELTELDDNQLLEALGLNSQRAT